MPNPTAPPKSSENPPMKFKNQNKYKNQKKCVFPPGKLGAKRVMLIGTEEQINVQEGLRERSPLISQAYPYVLFNHLVTLAAVDPTATARTYLLICPHHPYF